MAAIVEADLREIRFLQRLLEAASHLRQIHRATETIGKDKVVAFEGRTRRKHLGRLLQAMLSKGI